jgi:hypothetical protein
MPPTEGLPILAAISDRAPLPQSGHKRLPKLATTCGEATSMALTASASISRVSIPPNLATDSKVSRTQHSECTNQFLPVFLNRFGNHRCLYNWPQTPQTNQQNASRRLPSPVDEFAEILVGRNQHALRSPALSLNTVSSTTPGDISATYATRWPSRRSRSTIWRSTLSSARNVTERLSQEGR